MIIDSHAHYAHGSFQKSFRYLTRDENGYALAEGNLQQLMDELEKAEICAFIEPGISLQSCEDVLALHNAYPEKVFPAVGVHPTRAIHENWKERRELEKFAASDGVVAVGECGLDYHYKREEQHRWTQWKWFLYQLEVARKRSLPVILHVREAHKDALRILKRHPVRKMGGVVHCFNGSWETAQEYLKLGYHIGIGGAILQKEELAKDLREAVARIPLERILIETDAPNILPDCKDTIPAKQLRRARNTSLILPEVLKKIGEIKGIPLQEVEAATINNAIRLFRLPL